MDSGKRNLIKGILLALLSSIFPIFSFLFCSKKGSGGGTIAPNNNTTGRKVKIDEDLCTACEECVKICSAVFEMGDDVARVRVDGVASEYEELVQEAIDSCKAKAIFWVN